jgi:hypothetical protein
MAYPTITNTFLSGASGVVSGSTAIHSQWNTNFSDVVNGLSDGTKDLNLNLVTANNIITTDIYSVALTDYSAVSTITGWSSITTKQIYYKKIGKTVLIYYHVDGTSNATIKRFTLPYTVNNYATLYIPVISPVNGAGYEPSICYVNFINSTTANFPMYIQTPDWYTGTQQIISGQFTYETA